VAKLLPPGRAARLALLAAALATLYSFRSSLLEQGYGGSPESRAAANVLAAALAAASLLAYRYSSQGLAAVAAAYVLLEVTLLPQPSIARTVVFMASTYVLARLKEGMPRVGLAAAALSASLYLAGVAAVALAAVAAVAYAEAPAAALPGDAATFYALISSTMAWKYLAYLAAIAAVSRVLAVAVELGVSAVWRGGYARAEALKAAESMRAELRAQLSPHESFSLWIASTLLAMLAVATVYEGYAAGPPTVGHLAAGTLAVAAGSIALRALVVRAFAGNARSLAAIALLAASAIAAYIGLQPLLEAVGLEASYDDPLAPLASPDAGVRVEERLRQLDSLATILVRLLWGG
jgi:hypothetical protein